MEKHLNFYRATRPNMTEADFERTESVIADVWDMLKEKDLAPIEQLEVLENCTAFVKGETWWVSPADKETNVKKNVYDKIRHWMKYATDEDIQEYITTVVLKETKKALLMGFAFGVLAAFLITAVAVGIALI